MRQTALEEWFTTAGSTSPLHSVVSGVQCSRSLLQKELFSHPDFWKALSAASKL
jgi:hypothetical protein